jgi:hypothetical protein
MPSLNDKVYKVELNGRQAMSLRQGGMSLTLKIKSPMWNDLQVILNHQHRPSLSISSSLYFMFTWVDIGKR